MIKPQPKNGRGGLSPTGNRSPRTILAILLGLRLTGCGQQHLRSAIQMHVLRW